MSIPQLEIFPWNENFATGIDEIDTQHRRLVDLLNILVGHMAFNADVPTLNKIFDELRDYTCLHFSTEEGIWHEYFKDDSWEMWHKDAHGDFIAKVLEIKQKETELSMDEVIVEIVSFLTHWLALHIIESDKRMAKVVLALPTGISLERAKEQANEEMAGSTRLLINTVMGMYDKLANRTIELTREINRRKEAEEALRTTQDELMRLKNAAIADSQSKSLFLANMSHEIRTPMTGVIGMTEVLLKSPLNSEQRRMASTIRDSAQVQLSILNDILDFSKIEAGKLDLSIEPFAFDDVIEKTCNTLAEHANKQGVVLRRSIDPELPNALQGDALRLRQILTNFTTNAIKFSSGLDHPGEVDVSARLVSREGGKIWIALSVSDNGIGMDAATMDRIFQPFSQADATTTRKYGGTGLGLVICMRLAEAMGGDIQVNSSPGAGSTFTARLPFERVDESKLARVKVAEELSFPSRPQVPRRNEAIEQKRLILVVEDNETNQEVIRQQLAMLGYRCDIAADGREGFSKWLSGDYGVVLTDIHMPYMDGYQLAAVIRNAEIKQADGGRTPILALTANVLKGESDRCLAAGMDSYLAKPVSLADLKAAIESHLPEQQPVTLPTFSVMVLDDETFMHDIMTYVLQGIGQNDVSCYETGEAALDALDNLDKKPDVILLDINMPGMDGIEVVQQLARRHFSGCLILFSGEDELMLRTTEKLAQEGGLFVPGSMKKPPLPDRLKELLHLCCRHKNQAAERIAKRQYKTYDVADLRKAIANGELVNYYQPKVLIPGGEWIGVETLVRWRHPEDGLVFPDQFIPLAESEGLINDLTRVVLQQAVRQARIWRDAGYDLRVALNVSMEDLTDAAFADFAIEQANLQQVPPHTIVLEITEGRLMKDYATALHVLSRLRLKRFRLSIDDFGTGHSSLAQLRDLPFDELKIDRGFTHNAGEDARLRAIFEGSLDMARHLQMEVVAEGVENEKDWEFLVMANCDIAQGYYVSRPLPPEELPAWHEQWLQRFCAG